MSDEWVVVVTARSPAEASMVQALLEGEGIPTVVEGDALVDEWAMAQKLLGRIGTEVKVPRGLLARAQELIADAKSAVDSTGAAGDSTGGAGGSTSGAEPTEEEEEDAFRDVDRSWPFSAWLAVVILGFSSATLLAMFVMAETERRELLQDPLYRYEFNFSGTFMKVILKETGAVVSESTDQNANRIPEQYVTYDGAGNRTWVSVDENEDGLYERVELYSIGNASPVSVSIDADGDTFPESITIETADGVIHEFVDRDGDRRYDQ